MSAIWYCEIDGKEHGPMTAAQLRQMAVEGKLKPTHPVWKEGMKTKAQARSVNGLFNAAPAPAVAAPAAPKKIDKPVKKEESLDELECIETIADVETPDLVELETIEVEKPKKKKRERVDELEEVEEKPEVVAEAKVVYREGHPDVEGPLEGDLILDTKGLRFIFEEDDEEFYLKFDKIDTFMEPTKGEYSPSVTRRATAAKVGGAVGKVAAGLLGRLIGDTAGDIVEGVGKTAAGMAGEAGKLGKPPRNRIVLRGTIRKQKCRFVFDVDGKTREEMTAETKDLYKKITRTHKKSKEASAPVEEIEEIEEEGSVDPTFEVNSGGEIGGPYPLDDLQSMLAAGQIDGDALIRVTGWIPSSMFSGTSEEVAEDNYEVVEEEETPAKPTVTAVQSTAPPKPAAKPKPAAPPPKSSPPSNDGDLLKVDAEFQLD